jgi:CBS domain-containing protein
MRVRDIMSKEPACCTPACSAQVAANLMREAGVGFLPVLEKFSRRLLGVVTDRDLCLFVVAQGRPASKVTVRECMTPNPLPCRGSDDVETALELMRGNALRRLPVVNEEGTVEGVISVDDLIRYAQIEPKNIKAALSRICEPQLRGRPRLNLDPREAA